MCVRVTSRRPQRSPFRVNEYVAGIHYCIDLLQNALLRVITTQWTLYLLGDRYCIVLCGWYFPASTVEEYQGFLAQ
jgi:hypothetical protein